MACYVPPTDLQTALKERRVRVYKPKSAVLFQRGKWTREALDTLLRNRPDLCQQLLTVLGERMAEDQKLAEALLTRDEEPQPELNVV